MTNVDIDSGTIDGVTIATSTITVGSGKTLDVSAGTLTLANDQISGDKINGGTIGSVTITQLGGAMDCNNENMTNVDIDSGTIDGTTIGAASASTGQFTTCDATTDFTIGSLVITDNQIQMTLSSDTVTIAAAANGVLNITTVDAGGTAGDINLTADGQLEYRANDAAGHIFDINGTNQVSIIDGMIQPVTDNDIDLGSAAKSFKDAHIQGAATVGSLVIGSETLTETLIGNIVSGGVSTNATSAELNLLDGSDNTGHPSDITLAAADQIIVRDNDDNTMKRVTLAKIQALINSGGGGFVGDTEGFILFNNSTNVVSISGTVSVPKLSLTDNLADALNITQGSNSYIKFTTTNSSEQIVIGKNSTFNGTTIANLGTVTTADINGGSIDGTTVGAASASTGKFTTCDATTDFTIGSLVITDNQIQMTLSSDTVTIAAAANGVLNITTVDAGGTAGDINLTADGQLEYRANDAAGHIFDINGTNQVSIIDGMIQPVTDNDIDLGSAAKSFKDAHIQGTATIGTVDINGGTIDGVTIATSTITVGSGKTLDVSAGTLTLANDQISGDKINGGTIGSVTITQLGGAMDCNNENMTNVDIDSGTIDGTTVGAASASTGKFTTLSTTTSVPTFGASSFTAVTGDDDATSAAVLTANKINIISYGSSDTTYYTKLPSGGSVGDTIYAIADPADTSTSNVVYILSYVSTVFLNGVANIRSVEDDVLMQHVAGTAMLGPSATNMTDYSGGGSMAILILYKISGNNRYWSSINQG